MLKWEIRVEAVKANNLFYHLTYSHHVTPYLEEQNEDENGNGNNNPSIIRKRSSVDSTLSTMDVKVREIIFHLISSHVIFQPNNRR